MGIELDILKELGTINATLSELSSIASTVNAQIRNDEFSTRFNKIVNDIGKSYDVITTNFIPLSDLKSEADLINHFDDRHTAYTDNYLKEIHKPRVYADEAYEESLLLMTMKESKTNFPLLKRSYKRFDQLIDKWVSNDAWLAMSIDNLFKRLQALLNEIATLKQKDPEDAFLIYNVAFTRFSPYLELIVKNRALLSPDTS